MPFFFSNLTSSSQAIEEIEYSLQIKVTTSYWIPFQSISDIVVNVELTNRGNKTFNGTLTIEGKTDKHSYAPLEYPISNLTKDVVHGYARSFRTYDEGIYWFTVKIEEDHLSTIKLYQDSRLIDEGVRVKATSSILLYSFTQFLMIVAIVVPVGLGIVVIVYSRKRKK